MSKMKYNPITGELDLVENPNEIEFSIGGSMYSAPIGMTWKEWIYTRGPRNAKDGYPDFLPLPDKIQSRIDFKNILLDNECYLDLDASEIVCNIPTDVGFPIAGRKYFVPEFVDLGLPSGTLWAKFNIGATCEDETGFLLANGEMFPKEEYTETNFHGVSNIKPNSWTYDPATARWREALFYTPTTEDWIELIENTSPVVNSAKTAIEFIADKNGNKIVFPFSLYDGEFSFGLYGASFTKDAFEMMYDRIFNEYGFNVVPCSAHVPRLFRAVVKQ